MANLTIFNCSKCGKELLPDQRYLMAKWGTDLCAECSYFQALGVVTIEDYNKWLRGEWKIGGRND